MERTHPAPTGRDPYRGDPAQIAADLDVARRAGADEVVLGVTGDPGLDETLDVFARVAEAVEDGRPAAATGA